MFFNLLPEAMQSRGGTDKLVTVTPLPSPAATPKATTPTEGSGTPKTTR